MTEQEIGDPKLQALFEENGVVWTVDKNRAGVPRIHDDRTNYANYNLR